MPLSFLHSDSLPPFALLCPETRSFASNSETGSITDEFVTLSLCSVEIETRTPLSAHTFSWESSPQSLPYQWVPAITGARLRKALLRLTGAQGRTLSMGLTKLPTSVLPLYIVISKVMVTMGLYLEALTDSSLEHGHVFFCANWLDGPCLVSCSMYLGSNP